MENVEVLGQGSDVLVREVVSMDITFWRRAHSVSELIGCDFETETGKRGWLESFESWNPEGWVDTWGDGKAKGEAGSEWEKRSLFFL